METTITRMPLEWLRANPQARQDLGTEAELRQLGESLRHRQLAPVGAWEQPDHGLMIFGHRRLAAAKIVCLPDLEVKIFTGPLDEGDFRGIRLTENFLRSEMSLWEKVVEVEGFRKHYPKLMAKELAERLRIDAGYLTKLLAAAKCGPAWLDALKAGRVGISDCYHASRVSESERAEMLRMKFEDGATRDQLERSVRKARPKGADPVSSSTVTIPLPSGVKVTLKGRRMNLAEVLECLNECVDAAKKGIKEKLGVKAWQLVLRDKAKEVAGHAS
jgi:ParB-like chromosome segregation protein Spo0J